MATLLCIVTLPSLLAPLVSYCRHTHWLFTRMPVTIVNIMPTRLRHYCWLPLPLVIVSTSSCSLSGWLSSPLSLILLCLLACLATFDVIGQYWHIAIIIIVIADILLLVYYHCHCSILPLSLAITSFNISLLSSLAAAEYCHTPLSLILSLIIG